MKLACLISILMLAVSSRGLGQGIVHLDFEGANLTSFGVGPANVAAANGIPGWTGYINGVPIPQIIYNSMNLDEPAVSVQGISSPIIPAIQGNYSVYLQGGTQYAYGTNCAIGQTGLVPQDALSLIFWGYVTPDGVSFAGQALNLVTISSTPNYNIYGADISAFSGQVGQLIFTARKQTGAIIDNLQFSSTAVPEPGTVAFIVTGGWLLGCRRKLFITR